MARPYFETYYHDKFTLWKRASLHGRPAGRSHTRLRGAAFALQTFTAAPPDANAEDFKDEAPERLTTSSPTTSACTISRGLASAFLCELWRSHPEMRVASVSRL